MGIPDASPGGDSRRKDFIREIVAADVKAGKNGGRVHTRWPPEPNAYIHIGHAKAININFGIARDFAGQCNLRFDDTNPTREEQEFVDAIKEDIRWLGFDWHDREYYASDYFDQLYEWAELLIRKSKAYVCDLSAEQVSATRGTLNEPGINSPYRDRPADENLDLFRRMKAGEFPEGSRTLRAKIDMSHPNMNMRDPVMYRILFANHHRTGDSWCIYPTYDWAHGQCDSIEGITHSLCSIEFENHRPLYDWFLEELGVHHPQQIEFARLNMTYTVMSKRLIKQLVDDGIVSGYDDPRLPTIRGLRRRGCTPGAIREFCEIIGVARQDSTVDVQLFEHVLRQDLNVHAPRRMAVLDPVRLVIDNYPEGAVEYLDAVNNPEDESAGTRKVPFSRVLYIDRDDFRQEPVPKYWRLFPGNEVRLRYAYFVTCTGCRRDADGNITEVHCTYDPETRGGDAPDGRRVKSTLHWVSAAEAIQAEVRLYDHLFLTGNPMETENGREWKENINPDSLKITKNAQVEPSLAQVEAPWHCQFERTGYFCTDRDSRPGRPVFNRTVTLRDTWARIQKRRGK